MSKTSWRTHGGIHIHLHARVMTFIQWRARTHMNLAESQISTVHIIGSHGYMRRCFVKIMHLYRCKCTRYLSPTKLHSVSNLEIPIHVHFYPYLLYHGKHTQNISFTFSLVTSSFPLFSYSSPSFPFLLLFPLLSLASSIPLFPYVLSLVSLYTNLLPSI